MSKLIMYIRDWGWISCSESNVKLTEDLDGELYYKIKTNAIHLTIPMHFISKKVVSDK